MTEESGEAHVPVGLRADAVKALEVVAAGAGHDLAWALDQAVERYLGDVRREAEMEALFASTEVDDAAAENAIHEHPDCAAPCICCGRPMEEHGANQPRGGLAFQSYGHWPSAVFDMAAGWLEINVCEPCLFTAVGRSWVLHGERKGRSGPSEYVRWTWPERAPPPEGAAVAVQIGPEGMSAARLAALLGRQPPDRRVVLKGYENGFSDVSGLRECALKLNVHGQWWNGPHEVDFEQPDETAIEIVRIDRDPD